MWYLETKKARSPDTVISEMLAECPAIAIEFPSTTRLVTDANSMAPKQRPLEQ